MGREKVGEAKSRSILRHNILRDINYMKSKALISDSEVYYLIKKFLKDYLGLGYEFTKDELFKELKNIYLPYNIRADFFKFIDQVFMFEYSDVSYTDEELRVFLDQFKSFIDYLLISPCDKKKKVFHVLMHNWFGKLGSLFKKVRKDVLKEYERESMSVKPKEDLKLVPLDSDSKNIEINSMIEKIYDSLYNSDLSSAVELYKKVIDIYSQLSPDQKLSYFESLNSVYNSIKRTSSSG